MKIKVDENSNVTEVTITNNWEKTILEASGTIAKTLKNVYCEGVEWQRDHVWHKPTEQPEESKLVLTLTPHNAFICGPCHEDWEGTVDHFKIRTWAYVDDLKPTSFDETLEANKGILKGGEE